MITMRIEGYPDWYDTIPNPEEEYDEKIEQMMELDPYWILTSIYQEIMEEEDEENNPTD